MSDAFREASRSLITSVALITSIGRHGPNVMAAEWTFQVSYRPMRLMTIIHPEDATYENILDTKEFGANFLSDDQAALANLAGHYTGKEVNKLSSRLFQTYQSRRIHAPMIEGCLVNAECKMVQVLETGDHTTFLGDVVDISHNPGKNPLLYSQRGYWNRGPPTERKHLVYVTATINGSKVRLDGRLNGAQEHPQEVSLTVSSPTAKPILQVTARTDERGYFEFVTESVVLPKGVCEAKAQWRELSGSATVRVE